MRQSEIKTQLQLRARVLQALRSFFDAADYLAVETPIRTGALGRAWKRLRESQGPERHALRLRWAAATAPMLAICVVLGVAVARAEAPNPPTFLATKAIHTTEKPDPQPPDAGKGAAQNVGSTEARERPATKQTPHEPKKKQARDGVQASGRKDAPAKEEAPGKDRKRKNAAAVPVATGPVSAIGDSVLLGSAGALQREVDGLSVLDAEVGMQVSYATDILRSRRAAGQLGETVIVHLGNNGTFTADQFDEMMRVLSGVERVIFVNVRVPRAWETPNNEVLSAGVREYPNAELVDWYSASAGQPHLFVTDGVHLQPPGQRLYADTISARIENR